MLSIVGEVKSDICMVTTCEKYIKKHRKYCPMHMTRLYRTGRFDLKSNKEKLMERVCIDKDTNCWNWTGYLDEDGYGRTTMNGDGMKAHRASYIEYVGMVPKGLLVCHKCDNPACINPLHLFIGTQMDNVRDCVSKGRRFRGGFWKEKTIKDSYLLWP